MAKWQWYCGNCVAVSAPLAPAQETRIQALPVTDLEALGEALLDFQTVADLTTWLQQHA